MKRVGLIALAALLAACSHAPKEYSWEKFLMDGHRTGVSVPAADNVPEALGVVEDEKYKAPNGRVFKKGSTPKVAELMIAVQPQMAALKEVVAFSTKGLVEAAPESPLSNFIVDNLRKDMAEITGKTVDVAFVNFGGIRCNLPAGNILVDDVVSMLPFKNYGTYLLLPGYELRKVFERVARSPMAFSGAKLVVKDKKIESLLIGGKPLDDKKSYGVATIDFLIDGGDGFKLARGANNMIILDRTIGDLILEDIREIGASGVPLDYETDGRYVIEGKEKKLLDMEQCPLPEESEPSGREKLVIMHCNDTHSHLDPFLMRGRYVGGVIERAAFADSIRAEYPASKVLFVHAGDFNQGSSYFSQLGGALEIDLVNALGYDVVTLGNHELDNGIEDLANRLSRIQCEVVCSNCVFPDTLQRYVKPYVILKRGGMRIGIIGMESNIATMVAAPTAQRIQQKDDVKTINELAPYLRNEQGCDMVILLSHMGYSADRAVIPQVSGVDLVIGGHSHSFMERMAYVKDADGKSVPIVQDGCWGEEMGLVRVY